jgi:hypothetical protein
VVDKEAARVVRAIFLRVARDRWSLRRVAKEFDGQRALGAAWNAGKVHGIVRDERYKLGKDPIVDPRVWNRANAVLAERRPRRELTPA